MRSRAVPKLRTRQRGLWPRRERPSRTESLLIQQVFDVTPCSVDDEGGCGRDCVSSACSQRRIQEAVDLTAHEVESERRHRQERLPVSVVEADATRLAERLPESIARRLRHAL